MTTLSVVLVMYLRLQSAPYGGGWGAQWTACGEAIDRVRDDPSACSLHNGDIHARVEVQVRSIHPPQTTLPQPMVGCCFTPSTGFTHPTRSLVNSSTARRGKQPKSQPNQNRGVNNPAQEPGRTVRLQDCFVQAQVVDGADADVRDVGRAARDAVHEPAAVVAPVLGHGVPVAGRADRLTLAIRLDGVLAADVLEVREGDGEVGGKHARADLAACRRANVSQVLSLYNQMETYNRCSGTQTSPDSRDPWSAGCM